MVAIERTHNRYKAKKVSIQESMVIGYPAMPVARQMNRTTCHSEGAKRLRNPKIFRAKPSGGNGVEGDLFDALVRASLTSDYP